MSFRSERHCLFAFGLIITGRKHVLAGLDFLRSTTHDDVAATLAVALAGEAKVTEGTSQSHVAERLDGVAADNLHGTADGHELATLQFARLAEKDVHQFALLLRGLVVLVVTAESTDLVLVEPELEAAFVQPVGLGVDALVVKGMVARIADLLNLERQPAAVARRVAQELHVVACAAERGDVLAVLVVVGVAARSSMLGIVTAAFSWFRSRGDIVSSSSQHTKPYCASVSRSSFVMRFELVLV